MKASVTDADERELIAELGKLVVDQAAPEELLVFDETADEYFRDPDAVLDPKRRDEAVGFGLDLALVTPFVLAVATPVVQFLLEAASEAVRNEAKGAIATAVRRLLRRGDAPAGTPAALSRDQLRSVRDLAYAKARAVGVEEPQAAVIADAVVGSLAV
jgi:glycosyltransferase involved in cell wall biosynthesis